MKGEDESNEEVLKGNCYQISADSARRCCCISTLRLLEVSQSVSAADGSVNQRSSCALTRLRNRFARHLPT